MRTFAEKPNETRQPFSAKSSKPGRALSKQGLDVHTMLSLQRTIGNRGVARLLQAETKHLEDSDRTPSTNRFDHDRSQIPVHAKAPLAAQHGGSATSSNIQATRGLKPGAREDEIIRGRTVGEFVGDVARPVGTALGNVVGSGVGAITGVDISTTTNSGPTWSNHGAFLWHVGFNTTGRNGWLVQDIDNTAWRAKDATGSAVASPFTSRYWEAWAVDASGNVTPSVGADNDYWDQGSFQASLGAVEGHWATKGKVYFTTTDPATQGFTRNNPATNAGILLSSTSAPSGLGIARLHRYAQGTWDSTGAAPTHSGSAGP